MNRDEAAGSAAQGVEDARGVRAELGVDADVVTLTAQARRRELRHAGGGGVEDPTGVGALDPVFGVEAEPDAGADGEGLVLFGFFQEQLLHCGQALGFSGGQVIGLGEVGGEIVEFPDVLIGVPGGQPGA